MIEIRINKYLENLGITIEEVPTKNSLLLGKRNATINLVSLENLFKSIRKFPGETTIYDNINNSGRSTTVTSDESTRLQTEFY